MKKHTDRALVVQAISMCWPDLEGFTLSSEPFAVGGQGSLWELELRSGEKEALKVTDTSVFASADIREDRCWRAENEHKYARKFADTRFTVRLIDTGSVALDAADKTCMLYLMRSELGVPFAKFLEQHAHTPQQRTAYVLQALEETAGSIEALEQAGTLFRDYKSDNIVFAGKLGAGGRFVLCDMGLCHPNRLEGNNDNVSISGTKGFIAPEIIFNEPISGNRSDVFSLGCELWNQLLQNDREKTFDLARFTRDYEHHRNGPDADIWQAVKAMTMRQPVKRLTPQQAVRALHQLRLARDPGLLAAASKAALDALCGHAPQAGQLAAELPPELPAAALLGAAVLLQQNNTKAACSVLEHAVRQSQCAAAAFYLAQLKPARQRTDLLRFAARNGYAPAQLMLNGRPVSSAVRLAALKTALRIT